MKTILMAATVLALAASPALAGDDPMAGYYGNTVIATSAMGESHIHYKADHTVDGTLSSMMGSFNIKGTWAIDDKGQLCRTFEQVPPGMPNPTCLPLEAHKPGDTWTVSVNGQSRTLSMKAGLQ
jgi:hypothetical protein